MDADVEASAITEVRTVTESFIWEIRGFSWLDSTPGAMTKSSAFSLNGHSWLLEMWPGGRKGLEGWLALYVRNATKKEAIVRQSVQLLSADGVVLRELKDGKNFKFRPNGCAGYRKMISRADVLDPKKGFLDNDTLRIKLIVQQAFQSEKESVKKQQHFTVPLSLCGGLNKDMEQLLETGKHSDVKLIVGDTEIPAHRAILSARSPFFEAMFSHKMSENLEGTARCEDITLPVFWQLLRFIYTGSCKMDVCEKDDLSQQHVERKQPLDFVTQLLMAADRFQVPELVLSCTQRLLNTLTPSNAIDRLELAESYRLPILKKAALFTIRADAELRPETLEKLTRQQLEDIMGKRTPSATVPSSSEKQVQKTCLIM